MRAMKFAGVYDDELAPKRYEPIDGSLRKEKSRVCSGSPFRSWPTKSSGNVRVTKPEGVKHVKQQGGIVIALDDATCDVNSMPRAAIATGCVDYVLPPDKIADALVALVGT